MIYKNLSMIIAVDKKSGGIGNKNKLPFDVKEDMLHFRNVTMGKSVIFGNNTYQNLPKKPLPHRQNIVLTRNQENKFGDNVVVFHNIEELKKHIENNSDVEFVVCGGKQIYEKLLECCNKIYLTLLDFGDTVYEYDTFVSVKNFITDDWNIKISPDKNTKICAFMELTRK